MPILQEQKSVMYRMYGMPILQEQKNRQRGHREKSAFLEVPMERIQKLLAHQGVASRRQVDLMLQQGRISVDGKLARPGDRINGREKIALDGKLIRIANRESRPKLMMYHKPTGQVCTRSDPEGRPDVFQNLPNLVQGRWVSIGRLDINTSGLILFSNQGELANRLMHPSYEIEREYAVRVHGVVNDDMLHRLSQGVELDDGIAKFDQIIDSGGRGTNHWYHVILKEGKNREVRRLWEAVGVQVSRRDPADCWYSRSSL